MPPVISPLAYRSISTKQILGLLAAICVLAIAITPAAAGAAAGSDSAPELNLMFPTGQVQLSGSEASVWSTCEGPEAHVCHGTLTLTASGNKRKISFSVITGTNQSLTVPLEADPSANRVVAIVRTDQGDGVYLRSRIILHVGK